MYVCLCIDIYKHIAIIIRELENDRLASWEWFDGDLLGQADGRRKGGK